MIEPLADMGLAPLLAAADNAIGSFGLVDRAHGLDLPCRQVRKRADFQAVMLMKPQGQRKTDRTDAVRDVVGEALGEARVNQGLRLGFRHALTLQIVDQSRNTKLYGLGRDAETLSLHNVGMTGQAYPNHLAAWRLFRHLTQEELAEAVGCSVASIGHWETGARRLTDKWLPQLATALNTSVGYIMEHDPESLPTDVLDIWASIPDADRPRAIQMLKVFARTGTDG